MQSVVVFLLPFSFLAGFSPVQNPEDKPLFCDYLFLCHDGHSADTRNTFSFGHNLPKTALGALQGEMFGTGLWFSLSQQSQLPKHLWDHQGVEVAIGKSCCYCSSDTGSASPAHGMLLTRGAVQLEPVP